MKKFIFGVFCALLVFISIPSTLMADIFAGSDGWSVTFDGENMISNFKSSDIDDEIFKMQPGDTVDFALDLSNSYSVTTNWYMTNEVLKSLEDSQKVAENGAYTYVLTYYNPEGEARVLFDSKTVGGDALSPNGEEGLYQATDNLKDFFYLDTLAQDEKGNITLTVSLDGETQGNDYQDTLAKLQMNFAVELVKTDNETIIPHKDTVETETEIETQTTESTEQETEAVSAKPKKDKNVVYVQTGDNQTRLYVSIALIVIGVILMVVGIIWIRKTKHKEVV